MFGQLRNFDLDDQFPAQYGIPCRAAGSMGFSREEDDKPAGFQVKRKALIRLAAAEIRSGFRRLPAGIKTESEALAAAQDYLDIRVPVVRLIQAFPRLRPVFG